MPLADSEDVDLAQICDAATVLAMREAIERVEISEPVGRYLVDVVRATRSLAGVEVGSSPRGALALLLASRPARLSRDASSSFLMTSRHSPSPVSHIG